MGAVGRGAALCAVARVSDTSSMADTPLGIDEKALQDLRDLGQEVERLRLVYQFGIEEMLTKITILRQEFEQIHDYSPIEHVRSRLKSVDSMVAKAQRYGCGESVEAIRGGVRDIAGIRITCSFVSDVYWIAQMLQRQPDVETLQVKDYISEPKPNGYRSLHLILAVPVFLSESTEQVPVELQIRTIAMDFWASMEHKLNYKYHRALSADLLSELGDAARLARELDDRMARLREEIRPEGW